jgi:tripartite-type tricarboxylate transporter receptor subunit TctC
MLDAMLCSTRFGGAFANLNLLPETAPYTLGHNGIDHAESHQMTKPAGLKLRFAAYLLAANTAVPAAQAQDFYAGRQISLIVGAASGGGYDLLGRLMARHIGRHIPGNPTIVTQNMPAAGSIAAANHITRIAPRDGTVIGLMQRGILLAKLSNSAGVQYELGQFTWLGSLNSETGVVFAMSSAPHRKTQDLFDRELIVGANNNADPETAARLYNALLGTKFKLVTGYTGTPAIQLAMERGEVHGIADWSWSSVKNQKPGWLTEGQAIPLLQAASQRHKELPDLPNVLDLVKPGEPRQVLELFLAQKTVARPVIAPQGLPPERTALLRSAFIKLAADAEFLAEADRQKLEVGPISGEEVDKVIAQISATPNAIAERFKAITAGQ